MFCYCHKFIFLPVVLMIIGFILLLTNLSIIDASVWQWWPILIVVFAIYILALQARKKKIAKVLMWKGVIERIMKSDKVEKILENENVQKELKKVGDIAEHIISGQIDKLHKKYTKKGR